jgi:hypothetical protein
MSNRKPVIIAYLGLLALSLPVPLLHHYQTDRVIETMRPFFKDTDGRWVPMLMPAHILMLRWLGQLSWGVPWFVAALLAFSFKREVLARFSTLCAVAICECAFTTLYAFYSTLLLGVQWIEWIKR